MCSENKIFPRLCNKIQSLNILIKKSKPDYVLILILPLDKLYSLLNLRKRELVYIELQLCEGLRSKVTGELKWGLSVQLAPKILPPTQGSFCLEEWSL